MSKEQESATGVMLPANGIIDVTWAEEQMERVSLFSSELLNFGRAEIFKMLQLNLSQNSYSQAVSDLGFTVETSQTYINYLDKREVLEAIKDKYYTALSLSACEYITDNVEDSLALCDICVAKYGKLTADNLKKAATDSGQLPKKMSSSAISIETLKKKALHEWLLDEYGLSDDDILQASSIAQQGKIEYLEKMLAAYSLLEDWKEFYAIIAKPIHATNNTNLQRFLADMNDASGSISEYLVSETNYHKLQEYKETFENEVYPKLSFAANT